VRDWLSLGLLSADVENPFVMQHGQRKAVRSYSTKLVHNVQLIVDVLFHSVKRVLVISGPRPPLAFTKQKLRDSV